MTFNDPYIKQLSDSGPSSFSEGTSEPKSPSRERDALKYILLLSNIDTVPVFATTTSIYKPADGAILWFSLVVIATTPKAMY